MLFTNWTEHLSLSGICIDILHVRNPIKGTQDWEFCWLQFWNLHYFFVSYVKILRFYKKIVWLGHYWGRYDFYDEKNFWARSKFFCFFSSSMDPKYDPILVFWKFNQLNAPGTTLCVGFGVKMSNFIPLSLRLSRIWV